MIYIITYKLSNTCIYNVPVYVFMFLNCWFSPIFRQRITAVMMSTSFYDRCLYFLFSPPTICQSPSTHWKRKPPLSSCRALRITSKALGLTALFGPLLHSVFGKSVRTNNDVEGWHNRVNTHAQKSNLQFYLLIELMYKEASKKNHLSVYSITHIWSSYMW